MLSSVWFQSKKCLPCATNACHCVLIRFDDPRRHGAFPIVVPISIAGLSFFYFSQAELFRTSYSAPNMLSISITNAAMRLLDFTGIMLAIGQFLVVFYIKYNYSGVWTVTEQVGLALSLLLSILLIIIPSININKRLIPF